MIGAYGFRSVCPYVSNHPVTFWSVHGFVLSAFDLDLVMLRTLQEVCCFTNTACFSISLWRVLTVNLFLLQFQKTNFKHVYYMKKIISFQRWTEMSGVHLVKLWLKILHMAVHLHRLSCLEVLIIACSINLQLFKMWTDTLFVDTDSRQDVKEPAEALSPAHWGLGQYGRRDIYAARLIWWRNGI